MAMQKQTLGWFGAKSFRFLVVLMCSGACALGAESGTPGEYARSVVVTPLLVTGTTASGQPIVYPKTDAPEVRVLLVEIPPGMETGWHLHRMPAYAYLLSGSVTVELKNGTHYTFHAGEAFAETVGVLHNGKNTGTEPARLIMTVTGEKGVPTAEKAK